MLLVTHYHLITTRMHVQYATQRPGLPSCGHIAYMCTWCHMPAGSFAITSNTGYYVMCSGYYISRRNSSRSGVGWFWWLSHCWQGINSYRPCGTCDRDIGALKWGVYSVTLIEINVDSVEPV